ncbi:MAG: DUF2799 domain-containing protein [Boseongicola sp.]
MSVARLKWMAVAAFLGLAGCATLNEDACREGDWSKIGFRDGSNGRSPDFLDQHVKACSSYGVSVNQSKWEAGRQEGLKTYCTSFNAYREGSYGRRLKSVCPLEVQDLLERSNDRGMQWYYITREIADLEREIRYINSGIASLPADSPRRASLMSERNHLRLRILHLRNRRHIYR